MLGFPPVHYVTNAVLPCCRVCLPVVSHTHTHTQNMGIEYDEAMETIHVIRRDGQVRGRQRKSGSALLFCKSTGTVPSTTSY